MQVIQAAYINKAAIKAMVVNRIGDFGLSLGMLTIFLYLMLLIILQCFSCTLLLLGQLFLFIE